MKSVNNSIVNILVSSDPKISKIRNYIFRHKEYKDWIQFLRFGLQKLVADERLSDEEKILLSKSRKAITRFAKVKRPAAYLKAHLAELKPAIDILLNYE